MTKPPVLAAAVLAAVVALVVAACGASGSGDRSTSASPGDGTDLAFVQEMVPHHRSAVDMARIALERGRSSYVRGLARDIVRTQTAEIDRMERVRARIAAAGVKPAGLGVSMHDTGMHGATSTALRTATSFDRAFVDEMTPHHRGAITMARIELQRGQDAELKQIAKAIIAAQEREIGQMRAFRAAHYGAPRAD